MSETLYTSRNDPSDEEPMEETDVWDDSLLIKAYDRAVDMAKQKIVKKLSEENGTEPSKDEKNTPSPSAKPTKNKPAEVECEWAPGMPCRAIFSEDGLEYEATLLEVSPWKGTCTVSYVGYNNEEGVFLSDLQPSKGPKARKLQEKKSSKAVPNHQGETPNMCSSEIPKPYEGVSEMGVIAPPPPPHVMAHFPKDESDALSAMLMSWYMSGYHTGYYQGLTRSKSSKCAGDGRQTTRLN